MAEATVPARGGRLGRIVFSLVTGVLGAWLLVFGGWLLALGGSPYYVIAGVALIATAVLLWMGRAAALLVYALLLAGTMVWALWEVGLDFWQLAPRGDILAILGLLLLFPWVTRGLEPRGWRSVPALALTLALLASLIVAVAALLQNPHDREGQLAMRRAAGPVTFAAAPRRLAGLCRDLGWAQMVAAGADHARPMPSELQGRLAYPHRRSQAAERSRANSPMK